MTVKELIEVLDKLPPWLPVMFEDEAWLVEVVDAAVTDVLPPENSSGEYEHIYDGDDVPTGVAVKVVVLEGEMHAS